MTDPLITAANAISTASPNIRAFAQLSAQRTIALEQKVAALTPAPPVPPPVTTGTGIGLLRYGGSLSGTSHLTDGTYELVVASWTDRPILATCSGVSFAYQATDNLNLADPSGEAATVIAGLRQYPGVDGLFLDNVNVNNAAVLPFVKVFGPLVKQAGFRVMFNASGFGGQGSSDDGTADLAWFLQVGPYATHLMSEYFQQGRGGPLQYDLRLRGSATYADYWDGWQKLPAAAHQAGCAFCGLTIGRQGSADSDMIYGRASMLTAADHRAGDVFFGGGVVSSSGNYLADPYDSVWTAKPVAPAVDPVAGTATL